MRALLGEQVHGPHSSSELFLTSRHTLTQTCFSQTWQPAKINNLPSECIGRTAGNPRPGDPTRRGAAALASLGAHRRRPWWTFCNRPNASCGFWRKKSKSKRPGHPCSPTPAQKGEEDFFSDSGFIIFFIFLGVTLISRSRYAQLGGQTDDIVWIGNSRVRTLRFLTDKREIRDRCLVE